MEFCSPTKDEFCRLAKQGNLIPVTRRLSDQETPLTAYRKIRGQGESFLFESVEGGAFGTLFIRGLQSSRYDSAIRRSG